MRILSQHISRLFNTRISIQEYKVTIKFLPQTKTNQISRELQTFNIVYAFYWQDTNLHKRWDHNSQTCTHVLCANCMQLVCKLKVMCALVCSPWCVQPTHILHTWCVQPTHILHTILHFYLTSEALTQKPTHMPCMSAPTLYIRVKCYGRAFKPETISKFPCWI